MTSTTDCACNAAEGYEWALLPAELQSGNTPPNEPVTTTWFGSIFETGSSYLNAALTTVQTATDTISWTGWGFAATGLMMLLLLLRPRRKTIHIHHRGRRRAGLKR